jgi:hypothetical protein
MTCPYSAVRVKFRNSDTGRANEAVLRVKDLPCRSDAEIASDARWIVKSWRNVDVDSIEVTNVERAEALVARSLEMINGRAAV